MKYMIVIVSFILGAVLAIPIIQHLSKTGFHADGEFKTTSTGVVKDGKWTYWQSDTQKRAEGEYKDGFEVGKWTYWYENGQKLTEGEFRNGKREGLWTEWYENGQKKLEGNYKDGLETGPWTYWYENGFKRSEGEYYKGGQVDDWVYFSDTDEGKETGRESYPKVQ